MSISSEIQQKEASRSISAKQANCNSANLRICNLRCHRSTDHMVTLLPETAGHKPHSASIFLSLHASPTLFIIFLSSGFWTLQLPASHSFWLPTHCPAVTRPVFIRSVAISQSPLRRHIRQPHHIRTAPEPQIRGYQNSLAWALINTHS